MQEMSCDEEGATKKPGRSSETEKMMLPRSHFIGPPVLWMMPMVRPENTKGLRLLVLDRGHHHPTAEHTPWDWPKTVLSIANHDGIVPHRPRITPGSPDTLRGRDNFWSAYKTTIITALICRLC